MIDILLREVDTARVLAASAALQLDLQNVNELLLLQTLSTRAAAVATPPGRQLSSSAIRRFLACDEVGGPTMSGQLDEFDGIPVVEVPLPPRRLLVLEGFATASAQVADRLLRAVLTAPPGKFPVPFTAQVSSAARFLLGLSDLLARRFERTVDERAPALTRKVTVPSAERLQQRSRLVTFSFAELFAGLSESESTFLHTHFCWQHGHVTPSAPVDADPNEFGGHPGVDLDSSLVVRPLIDTHLGIVVASPTELATALRHFIIVSAYRHDCLRQLVNSLTQVAVSDATFLLDAMTDEPLVGSSVDVVPGFARLTAPFDGDKVMDLRVFVDTLADYEPSSVWGAATSAEVDVAPLDRDPARTLVLEVRTGVGRDDQLFSGASDGPSLMLPADDLQTILTTPGTDSLTLWYFARALGELGKSTQMMSFSMVDTFSLFRKSNDSFYLSDGARPTFLSVTPGHGQELREAAHRAAGSAFVLYGRGISRSISVHADASPVRAVLADPSVCFARLNDVTAWGRVGTSGAGEEDGRRARVLAESLTYWMWQLHLVAPELLGVAGPQPELIVELRLTTPNDAGEDADRELASTTWVSYDDSLPCPAPPVVGANSTGLCLVGRTPSEGVPGAPPNEFDRQLVSALVDGLAVRASPPEVWSSERRRTVVDRVAPPGLKIMTHIISADDDLLLWPGHLPDAPYISDAATAIVLDELGRHLAASGFGPGKVADADRTAFLNDHVTSFLQDWLARELVELAGQKALRELLRLHEALLHEMVADQKNLPIRIACFGEIASDVARIRRHRQKATTSAIALRYLIERLSARPGGGTRDLTRERCDLLLAIAAEIVNKGMLSDALHGGLADNEISVLRSSRLGISREQENFTRAMAEFAEGLTARTIAEARELADAVHLDRDDIATVETPYADGSGKQASTESPLEPLNALAVAEYGFSYSQLVNGCGGLINASRRLGHDDVGELDLSEAIVAIRTSADVGDGVARKMLARLSLEPVDDFSAIGADVFPWRFTRDRSFLLRPLVAVTEKRDPGRVSFGHRSLWLTPRRWMERHLSGRLQATSPAMRTALAAQRDAKGGQFEIEVEQALEALGAGPIRRRFVRAGSVDLAHVDGENLGDIDVLAATPSGVLVAVEAKDLETARTPAELAREVRALSTGPKAATARLARRVEHLSANVRDVEDSLCLEHVARRRVVPLVVTNAPLLGSLLSDSPVPIVALAELPVTLAGLESGDPRRARRR